MRKYFQIIILATTLLITPHLTKALISNYTFTSTNGTYTPIVGTNFLTGLWDDGSSASLITIPFTFLYNGASYTTLAINANGFITLGAIPADVYCGLQSSAPNSIAAYGTDLVGASAASSIQYTTIGVAPNRQFVIQWTDCTHYSGGTAVNHWSFQIVLNETSNTVQVIWGTTTDVTAMGPNNCNDNSNEAGSVGLLGGYAADFNIRSVTNGTNTWLTSIAGAGLNAVCEMTSTNIPVAGLTYNWTPGPLLPMAFTSCTTIFVNNTLAVQQGTSNIQVIMVQVNVSGATSPFNITGINLSTAGSTSPLTDIDNAKVYFTGNNNIFASTTQFGTTTLLPNGNYSVSGSATLAEGLNYFWITYDIDAAATVGHTFSGCCTQITGSGTMGARTPAVTCPTGSQSIGQAGSWTAIATNGINPSGGLMLLLPDGSVMAKTTAGGASYGNTWNKLTPDIHGSYVNGNWSTLAPMANTRLYFSSQVMKDGRVYVAGGEYGTGGAQGEVYNPVTNTWASNTAPGQTISDANSEILSDGRILQAAVNGSLTHTLLYNPVSNTYSAGPTALGIHNESAWVKLPDNSILYINRLSTSSERYIPSLNQWIADASVPVQLYDAFGDEAGAGLLLPDGRAFFLGSSGHTAYYTPSGTNNPGVWNAGPDIPGNWGTPDAAAAMMANGKILFTVSPTPTAVQHFPSPTSYLEFDYLTGKYTLLKAPGGGTTRNSPCYNTTMLDLPDGSIMYSNQNSSTYYVYTPLGTPLVSGKPVITNISAPNCTSYTITGTQFNGISQGAAYGDDWQMETNYPLVRLTSGVKVWYARTYNWNTTGVQRGAQPDTAQFDLPAGLAAGTYNLEVIANGIASNITTLTVSAYPNNWTGAVSTAWETPGNWSCGVVADANTDVVINSGSAVVSSLTAICRTLTIAPGANVTVNTGGKLTVVH